MVVVVVVGDVVAAEGCVGRTIVIVRGVVVVVRSIRVIVMVMVSVVGVAAVAGTKKRFLDRETTHEDNQTTYDR